MYLSNGIPVLFPLQFRSRAGITPQAKLLCLHVDKHNEHFMKCRTVLLATTSLPLYLSSQFVSTFMALYLTALRQVSIKAVRLYSKYYREKRELNTCVKQIKMKLIRRSELLPK